MSGRVSNIFCKLIFSYFLSYSIDEQAAIGIHQFKHINEGLRRRDDIWQLYNEAFADLPVGTSAPDEPDTTHARHLYALMIDEKNCGVTGDQFTQWMHKPGIGKNVHYMGVYLHPYYRKNFGFSREHFPNASWISDRAVSLPLSPN